MKPALSALASLSLFAPAVVALRAPTTFEVLTGHQRLAIAQEAGIRFPAVVLGSGRVVWIEPDGTVTTNAPPPHDASRAAEPESQPG